MPTSISSRGDGEPDAGEPAGAEAAGVKAAGRSGSATGVRADGGAQDRDSPAGRLAGEAPGTLLILGLGFAAGAVARAARRRGWRVIGTTRQPGEPDGIERIGFEQAGDAAREATHLLCSVPPDAAGDRALACHRDALAGAGRLVWIGYFSTTGVYGDQGGGWVDEASPVSDASPRARRRIEAEQGWAALAHAACGGRIDLIRLAGIYGPGRSVFDQIRAGTARRIIAPGHCFGRTHRDDIAAATLAAMQTPPGRQGARVLNFSDDEPAESSLVLEYAAQLLGMPPPPSVPLAEAWATMSPMARSFWADNRKVSARHTQQVLGYRWRYPTFREGLRAVLDAEHGAQDQP